MTDSDAGPAGTRIAAAMRAALASPDRTAAWHLIETVAADWSCRTLAPGDGYTAEELDAAATDLGLPLPTALREAYRRFGRRDDLTRNQDPFCEPGELELYEGALVFRDENQGACRWGVMVEDLAYDDPPTYYRPDLEDKCDEEWMLWTDRLSLALAEMVLAETVLEEVEGLTESVELVDEVEALGWERLPDLTPDWAKTSWHLGPDVLAHVLGDEWINVRARTRAAMAVFTGEEGDD